MIIVFVVFYLLPSIVLGKSIDLNIHKGIGYIEYDVSLSNYIPNQDNKFSFRASAIFESTYDLNSHQGKKFLDQIFIFSYPSPQNGY